MRKKLKMIIEGTIQKFTRNFSKMNGNSVEVKKIMNRSLMKLNTTKHYHYTSQFLKTFVKKIGIKNSKHNRLTSGELLSNDRRAVGFVSS